MSPPEPNVFGHRKSKTILLAILSLSLIALFASVVFQGKLQKGPHLPQGGSQDNNATTSSNNSTTNTPTDSPADDNELFKIDASKPYVLVQAYERTGKPYYTQGLIYFDDDTIIESAGLYGESQIHKIKLDSGKIILKHELARKYFAEGIDYRTLPNGKREIYQLTWREKIVFVYDGDDFKVLRNYSLPAGIHEGWGLSRNRETINGTEREIFYFTDGSSKIYKIDPEDFSVLDTMEIFYPDGRSMVYLNELEMVKGKLWANIYLTNQTAVIDVENRKLEKLIDFTEMVGFAVSKFTATRWDYSYCLNGIAYRESDDTILLGGKKWNYFFRIKLKDEL